MGPAIPTADHDQGPPPLHVGDIAHLGRILLDGHHWATMPPGDPVAELLIDIEPA